MLIDLSQLEKVETNDDIEKENKRNEAILYLTNTDWYVIRKFETGKEIPDDVVTKRNEARDVLSI